ncbi:acyltransferase family protein [Arthrobacter sp. NA-172]|uniref:acyltransferase family protein n=1 Tax=Arthrobacter sp. NA-172 TaxID=3367524 RepID=UPI0037544F4B
MSIQTAPRHATNPAVAKAQNRSKIRLDIQGLRALAVLSVVADHFFKWPTGGFVGVDVFFVISGFLISGILLRSYEKQGRISFADFYRKRARRILPAALLVLAVTIAAVWALFPSGRAKEVTWDGLFALVFGANWRFVIAGTDYMQAAGPVSPLQHFWSLAVEEQFYVAWPLIIVGVLGLLVHRMGWDFARARRVLTLSMVIIVAGSFLISVAQTANAPTIAYFSTTSRVWELGIGALLALMVPVLQRIPAAARPALGYVGLGGIIASLFVITSETPFPAPGAALPVIATAMVIASGTGGSNFLYPLTNRVAVYVGDISYSLYLWHFPIIIVGAALLPRTRAAVDLLFLAAMFAVSAASYHLVEDKVRKSSWLEPGGKSGRPQPVGNRFKLVAVGMLALLIFATTAMALAVPNTPSAASASAQPADASVTPEQALAAQVKAAVDADVWPELQPSADSLNGNFVPEWKDDKCLDTNDQNVARCVYGDPTATKTAVLLGDSAAISWMPGLRESLGKQGWKIQALTLAQCPAIEVPMTRPNDPTFAETCSAHQQWAFEKVRQIQPQMVIASSTLATPVRMVGAKGDPNVFNIWRDASTKTLTKIRGLSKAQVVLLSPPPNGKNLEVCATKISKPSDCVSDGGPFKIVLQANKDAAAAVPGVRYVSTSSWFCTQEGVCPSFVGNTPVSVEGEHLTPAFSAKLAPVLGRAILG